MKVVCPADLIIENVSVITMDRQLPKASGIAIANGKIAGLLTTADSSWPLAENGVRFDGKGAVVMPGLIDAHCHLRALLSQGQAVSCTADAVSSIEDIIQAIHSSSKHSASGAWIRAFGYDITKLSEKRHPSRYDLDKAAAENPIRLRHVTRHVSILNSLALKQAGINAHTADPPGMFIERDPVSNEPTGMINGGDSWLSQHVVPKSSTDDLQHGLSHLQNRLLQAGITSVQDATPTNRIEDASFWIRAMQNNWPITVQLMADNEHHAGISAYIQRNIPSSMRGQLEPGPVKVVMESLPEIVPTLNELTQLAKDVMNRDGSSLAIHVVDPEMTWTAIEAIRQVKEMYPQKVHRHRFEHLSLCPEAFLPDIAELGIQVVTNPTLLHDHGDRYVADTDPSEHEWLYRMKSLQQHGIAIAAGSDAPVASLNPWLGIQTACTRKTAGHQAVCSKEAMDRWNALHLYTAGAANAAGWESKRGIIRPGYQADLIAVNQDPLTCPIDHIHATEVTAVWIRGDIVFNKRL